MLPVSTRFRRRPAYLLRQKPRPAVTLSLPQAVTLSLPCAFNHFFLFGRSKSRKREGLWGGKAHPRRRPARPVPRDTCPSTPNVQGWGFRDWVWGLGLTMCAWPTTRQSEPGAPRPLQHMPIKSCSRWRFYGSDFGGWVQGFQGVGVTHAHQFPAFRVWGWGVRDWGSVFRVENA